ncbi:MAG: hypothetical protein ABI759_10125 [Candidatus Solibacter sp.]
MQFIGNQLKSILERQQREVEVYDSRSYPRGTVKPTTALRLLELGSYVGIGNPKRIRAIRPLDGNMTIGQLHQASHTTVRPRDARGVIFAPDWVVEHRK